MQNTDDLFLHQYIFSEICYKRELYCDEFLLMRTENFLQAQNEI
jgi:hypothetical protein